MMLCQPTGGLARLTVAQLREVQGVEWGPVGLNPYRDTRA